MDGGGPGPYIVQSLQYILQWQGAGPVSVRSLMGRLLDLLKAPSTLLPEEGLYLLHAVFCKGLQLREGALIGLA